MVATDVMTTEMVANTLVTLCREGKFLEAKDTLYGNDIVSIEAASPSPDKPRQVEGIEAVRKKGEEWEANTEVHSMKANGPYVGDTQFAVHFDMDVTCKMSNQRMAMTEMALYDVKDGKIVREEFFYHMGG